MELLAWISGRERAALMRVRVSGFCLCLALLVAAGWLGWRESRLAELPAATKADVDAQTAGSVKLRLKQLSMVIYLAKVRQNALAMAITGRFDVEDSCIKAGNLIGLEDASLCVSLWKQSLRLFWSAAFREGGPPIPPELERDPWGAPFLVGQSEAVCGHFGAWCPEDMIRSAGPDGRPDTPDDIAETVPQHLGPAAAAQAGK